MPRATRPWSVSGFPQGSPNYPNSPPNPIWVRAGSAVDVKPGSPLEQLYGASNLSPVITHTGDPANFDKSALAN